MNQSLALMSSATDIETHAAVASREVVVRMRVSHSWHHRGDEVGQDGRPHTEPVTQVQELLCPAGYRFGARDFTTTRISGYCDGWNYSGRVDNVFVPRDEFTAALSMTLRIDSLTWVGPTSVAHPILGVFDVIHSEDITVRCVPTT